MVHRLVIIAKVGEFPQTPSAPASQSKPGSFQARSPSRQCLRARTTRLSLRWDGGCRAPGDALHTRAGTQKSTDEANQGGIWPGREADGTTTQPPPAVLVRRATSRGDG